MQKVQSHHAIYHLLLSNFPVGEVQILEKRYVSGRYMMAVLKTWLSLIVGVETGFCRGTRRAVHSSPS